MKKKIVISETQLKKIINNQINKSVKGQSINEDGILRAIKNMISPEVKGAQATMRGNLNTSSAIHTLMNRFGRVKMTDYIMQILRPVQEEITIIKSDLGRLQQFRVKPRQVPGKLVDDNFPYLIKKVDELERMVKNTPKGQVIDFGVVHEEIIELNGLMQRLIDSKQVSREGIPTLKNMNVNINQAIKKTENVVSQIATKR